MPNMLNLLNFLFRPRSSAAPTTPVEPPALPASSPSASPSTFGDSFSSHSGTRDFGTSSTAPALSRPTVDLSTRASRQTGRIPSLSASTKHALIELSDPESVTSLEDFASRIEKIDNIFSANGDPRGAFPALYRVITNQAVTSVREGLYEDNEWGSEQATDFGELYLKNLHGHLTGGRVSPGWQRYYALADNPNVSLERVVSVGATIHLVVDLPNSLARIGTSGEREADFMRFGDILLEAYPQMIASARAGYGIDMSNIFGLFIFGNIADVVTGEGTATRFGFQAIRTKAWTFGQWLQDIRWAPAKSEITISWRSIDGILANLDAAKIL